MSASILTVLLSVCLTALPQGAANKAGPPDETPDEAARAAMKEAPRRSKVGRIRGLQTISEVRFAGLPDDPYRLVASFGIPDRARVILTNQTASFGRFQLGSRLFGRDSRVGKTVPSVVLAGPGLQETLLDIELRRALLFWPNAPKFTGAGRTFTAKVGDFAIFMATVDESTGLPIKIQSFDKDGGAGPEFLDIQWNEADEAGRTVPASLTFAAGGQTIWTETFQSLDAEWRFADTWFLPPDRLVAVMGSQVGNQMHVRALGGTWIKRIPVAQLMPAETRKPSAAPIADSIAGSIAGSTKLNAVVQAAAAEWHELRKSAAPVSLAPHASVVLHPDGSPAAVEYESKGLSEAKGPDSKEWTWRAPKNIWAHPLETPKLNGTIQGIEEAGEALAQTAKGEDQPRLQRRLRFRVGEQLMNGTSRVIGLELALTVDVTMESSEDPHQEKEPQHQPKGKASDRR